MEPIPKQDDEKDALWELLGKSPAPQASPFFAARVVNLVRAEPTNRWGWLALILRPGLAVAVVAIAALMITSFWAPQDPRVVDQDFEIIVELDNLIALDQQTLWTDSSAYFQY